MSFVRSSPRSRRRSRRSRSSFPRDQGPHPDYRQEWWYLTGNLDAVGGERFGFELTIFRFALAPGAAGRIVVGSQTGAEGSPWRTRQVYLGHFAVTDVARHTIPLRREAGTRRARACGRAGESVPGLGRQLAARPERRAGCRSGLHSLAYRAAADASRTQRRARVESQVGRARKRDLLLLHPARCRSGDDRGRRPAAPGARPGLARPGMGQRQPRAAGEWAGIGSGCSSAMAHASCSISCATAMVPKIPTALAPGSTPAGHARPLSRGDVRMEVLATGPTRAAPATRRDGAWCVPATGLDVTVHPVLAEQELVTSPRYWEGAVDVSGTRAGRPVAGRGYVELVGYAGTTAGSAGIR